MLRKRLLTTVAAALLAATASACSEKLESGAACPSLCPEQGVEIQTAELMPVVFDTALTGLVARGTERFLLLAARGDTLETRAVLRYDSLFARTRRTGTDTTTFAIVKVDSAYLRFRVDTTALVAPQPVTIEAYDVDTAGVPDTAVAPILARFRPELLVGSVTFSGEQLADTAFVNSLRLPLDTAFVRARLTATPARLRLGLAVRSAGSAQVRLLSLESGFSPTLTYRSAPPTASDTAQLVVRPTFSKTPNTDPSLNGEFLDYTVPVRVSGAPPATALAVGGVPGRRSYLRFELPAGILDSATITRATLLLTQRPNPLSADQDDSLVVFPTVVLAGAEVTDPARAATIVLRSGFFSDSIRVAPGDSGEVRLDVTTVLRAWARLDEDDTPRALVLLTPLEGATPREVLFFSMDEANAQLRPRLRISYVPRVGFGIP